MLFLVVRNTLLDDELGEVALLGLTHLLRHGGSPEGQSHLIHRAADIGHQRRTEGDMGEMGHVEHDAQTALDACHVVGGKFADLATHGVLVHVELANEVGQLTCIDLHGTGGRAESIGSTGLITIVFILLSQSSGTLRILTCLLQIKDLALDGDTHTGGEGEAARHTVDLAESALDALVGALHLFDRLLGCGVLWFHEIVAAIGHAVEVVVEDGQRLQALDEAVGIVVEDHPLVEQTLWVEDGLQLLHGLVSLVAPLVFHEGRHVTACAVFCLQRSVVALYHELCHVAHHFCITGHLVLVGKALVEDEVVVALEGVPIDTGIGVAVIGDELLQFHSSLRQRLDGERYILDEAGGADRTRTTHAGEDT